MDTLPMINWLNKELSSLLECEIGDEYSKNILNIETEPELKEFIGSLLDLSIAKNRKFLDELLNKIKKPSHHQNVTVYMKPKELDEPKGKSNKNKQSQAKAEAENQSNKKTNPNILLSDTANAKGPNRRVCNCQASKHALVANCLKCGRIVCEQEGSGPCYFCGNLVGTREEMEKISRGSNKGEQLKKELLSRTWKGFDIITENLTLDNLKISSEAADNDKLKKAIEHKNKLIEFDRTSAKRTQVIDDESDYFSTNSKWITPDQKLLLDAKEEELREKRFGSRLKNKTFTFDFAGRKVNDDLADINMQKYAAEIESILNDKKNEDHFSEGIANQEENLFNPVFIEDAKKSTKKQPSNTIEQKKTTFRLQDQELQEMKDDGMCLSLHQPYASLLVNGIMVHEGRTWYSPYRGRLWIHAAAKQASEVDINEIHVFYKAFYNNLSIKFPETYPTSCLVGYVDLADCLSSETYRQKFPNGSSQSDFVFICNNPTELFVKIPMPGQHKIYKLDKNIHAIAKKTSLIYHESMTVNKENNDNDI